MRRRVKEQLKKIGGMEFYDVNFSYIDLEEEREEYVSVPEQGGGTLIPEGLGKPGHLYTVSYGKTGQLGTYKLETQMTSEMESLNVLGSIQMLEQEKRWIRHTDI